MRVGGGRGAGCSTVFVGGEFQEVASGGVGRLCE